MTEYGERPITPRWTNLTNEKRIAAQVDQNSPGEDGPVDLEPLERPVSTKNKISSLKTTTTR